MQYMRDFGSNMKTLFDFDIGLEMTWTQGRIIKGSLRIRVEDKDVEEEECDELVLARSDDL